MAIPSLLGRLCSRMGHSGGLHDVGRHMIEETAVILPHSSTCSLQHETAGTREPMSSRQRHRRSRRESPGCRKRCTDDLLKTRRVIFARNDSEHGPYLISFIRGPTPSLVHNSVTRPLLPMTT